MSESAFEHNEGRPPTMRDVKELLAQLSTGRKENPRVLAINQHNIMLAKNNGFPLHMYHAKLDPQIALDEEQEARLATLGYVRNYIPRLYPRMLFRRNMAEKFALRLDLATGQPANSVLDAQGNGYVEERMVATKEIEEALRKQPAKKGQGPWLYSVTDLDPLPEAPNENPEVTIARLQGELDGRREHAEARGSKK